MKVGRCALIGTAPLRFSAYLEFVAGLQLTLAGDAREAGDVIDGVPGPHHQLAPVERQVAAVALGAEKPANSEALISCATSDHMPDLLLTVFRSRKPFGHRGEVT